MKQFRRCTRKFILSLLVVSIFVLHSGRIIHFTSDVSKDHIEDLSAIKYRTDALNLREIEQEAGKGVNEPPSVVYRDRNNSSDVSINSLNEKKKSEEARNAGGIIILSEGNGTNLDTVQDNQQSEPDISLFTSRGKEEYREEITQHDRNVRSLSRKVTNEKSKEIKNHAQHGQNAESLLQKVAYKKSKEMKDQTQNNQNARILSRKVTDEKLKEMKDQLIRAKTYLNFAPPTSNSHLVKDLRLRIKELDRAVGESTKDSDLSKSALQRSKSMDATLLKASRIYPDCSAMTKKLRAMAYNAEEQVQTQKNQAEFLVQIAGRTTPKGLHCLSMRLTAEYFALPPEERKLPSQQELYCPDSYHFGIFSDNVLACAVVVQSTISTAKEPERIVFHIVTDSLNFPAISMWFLLYPPGNARYEIQSIDSFDWFSNKYDATMQKSLDLRYTSPLNHLRFYLPDVFPKLNKILLLDHDVIVQRDLTELWSVDMKHKVNGAVETCKVDDPSFRRMDMLLNFSDPMVARRFDAKACTWAFGMNIFDLREWRRRHLTRNYEKYLLLGKKRPLWTAGSLPLGWVTFYNQTLALDKRWHVLGLGYHSGVRQGDIDHAAVIHYNGVMKPWLGIGLEKYKHYWRKHVKYSRPFLQQCNIQE